MPKLLKPISGIDHSCVRPCVRNVCDRIAPMLGIPNITFIYPNGDGDTLQPGSVVIDRPNQGEELAHGDAKLIVAVESQVTDMTYDTSFDRHEAVPFFYNPELGVKMHTNHEAFETTISFTYQAQSRQAAGVWFRKARDRLTRTHRIDGRAIGFHFHYHYRFNEDHIYILYEIFKSQHPDYVPDNQRTFEDWLRANAIGNFTFVSNQSGESVMPAMRETQTRVFGQFDFDEVPDSLNKSSDTGHFEASFNFKFFWDIPNTITLIYPCVVHQTPLAIEYLPPGWDEPEYNPYLDRNSGRQSLMTLEHFNKANTLSVLNTKKGVNIPFADDFLSKETPTSTDNIYTIVASLDFDNDKVFNFYTDVTSIEVNPHLFKFIQDSEYQYITQPNQSIVGLALYQNQTLLQKALRMEPNGDVYVTKPLDRRHVYRILFYIHKDLKTVDRCGLERLMTKGSYPILSIPSEQILFYEYIIYWLYGYDSWNRWLKVHGIHRPNVQDLINWLHNDCGQGSPRYVGGIYVWAHRNDVPGYVKDFDYHMLTQLNLKGDCHGRH